MNRSAAHQKLINTTAAQMTPMLLSVLKTMDEKPRAERTQEERLVYAIVCDVITERLEINDKVDEIYETLPLELHLTGYQAIMQAMNA